MAKLYHTGLDEDLGAKYVILPGDPGRVEKIAKYLDNAAFLAQNREYTSWIGELCGEKVLVMSTGMGGPSTAIGVEELYQSGVRTMVRIGTCGGMAMDVISGDLVIANAAIRMEGTSKEYVAVEFPAVSNFEVTKALEQSAKDLRASYHIGVVQCKDSYFGQHDPDRMPCGAELREKWDMWLKAGALASEMESSALFIVCQYLGARAGCVLSTVWNQERAAAGYDDPDCHDTDGAIRCAVHAVELMIQEDCEK